MPHAESDHDPFKDNGHLDDDSLIQRVTANPEDLANLLAHPSDAGEKAEGAIDYADIDDDDLAEDEDENRALSPLHQRQNNSQNGLTQVSTGTNGVPGIKLEDGLDEDPLDDLFGDVPSSPTDEAKRAQDKISAMSYDFEGDEIFGEPVGPVQSGGPSTTFSMQDNLLSSTDQGDDGLFSLESQNEPVSEEYLQQQRLFALSRATFGDLPPPPPETEEEALASMWPKFEKDSIPKFMELMPPKKARYLGKAPLKPPKPVQPTKLNLDIEADQEKAFRLSNGLHKRKFDAQKDDGLVPIQALDSDRESDYEDTEESDYENRPIGGKTWQDLQVICADWDINSPVLEPLDISMAESGSHHDLFDDEMAVHGDGHHAKRRKLNDFSSDIQSILNAPRFDCPSFDNFEKLASKIAKKPILDLNDPHLLLVEQSNGLSETTKKALTIPNERTVSTKNALRRYNISNDEAYDKLKQNHQSKVRSTLGNLTITHSMPALRLQWPYYRTKLTRSEARAFHRPVAAFKVKDTIIFNVPKHIKKKHLKGKDTQATFNQTGDLSFADNSNVLLLEYSEEYPTMLPSFGMGSRLVNYYRKKHADDSERPRADIGETSVLLPNDTSPLTQFGDIKAGELTPTIFNSMFKAPIYEHEPKGTDFLMVRSSTGMDGSKWYLRNIEHLRVVGQQFPSVEVPPPGGRKVTTASKNRLRMICYRLMRKKEDHRISVNDVTSHVSDSSDMQNRQKMKDFLRFDKENRDWTMPPGQTLPDSDAIRSLVSPEDVCLLEAMQSGEQHLEDEGFGNEFLEAQNEDEEVKEGQSVEQQLAPWQTTKNFLNAAANKAMLQVHGEGDPTGRGEAFSFLKVSMKGGFRALGESIEDKLDAKKLKEYGGHNYNVQKQAGQYRDTINHVWEAQKQSLSSNIEHSDPEPDPDDVSEPSRRSISRTDFVPSGLFKRRDDETASHMSKYSTDSSSGRILKIYRKVRDPTGYIREEEQIVEDPRVWKKYVALKNKSKLDNIDIRALQPGDDPALARAKIEKELGRLERNRDRRFAREKQKAGNKEGSPGSPSSPAITGAEGGKGAGRGGPGTTRKCANCGQQGHIKTNKKLCPMLNGTVKPEESGFGDSGFSSSVPVS